LPAERIKTGNYLLITTHGEHYLDQLQETEKQEFLTTGLAIKFDGPVGSNNLGAYHSYDYVSNRLAKGFDLLDFEAEGAKGNPFQDIYFFRKRNI